MNRIQKLRFVKQLASRYGATELKESGRKNKKYVGTYKGKDIHYGDSRYQDFIDHQDLDRRHRYRQRASKITDKNGKLTYKDKSKANFWSYFTLWP